MAISRPETLFSTKLAIGLAEGGSESTITLSTVPNETTGKLIIKQGDYKEIIKYTGVSGSTITGITRGLAMYGATGTVLSESAVTANKKPFSAGATIEMADVHYYLGSVVDWANGLAGSGGTEVWFGIGTNVDISLKAYNGDANKPFIMYDASEDKWVFSNDGISTTDVGGGTGSITAGNGISITAGSVSVNQAYSSFSWTGVHAHTKAIDIIIVDTGNDVGFTVTQNDTTNNPDAIQITNTGTGDGLQITQSGAGRGIFLDHDAVKTGVYIDYGVDVTSNESGIYMFSTPAQTGTGQGFLDVRLNHASSTK